jgi:hypothetical protein
MSLQPRRRIDLDARLSRAMARERGPDQTDAIMRRLGFRKVAARQARIQRMTRTAARAVVVVAAGAVAGSVLRLSSQAAALRRPEPVTVPHAVQRDLQQQQIRFDSLIRYLRQRAPSLEGTPQPPVEEDVDRSAIGPVRWI